MKIAIYLKQITEIDIGDTGGGRGVWTLRFGTLGYISQ